MLFVFRKSCPSQASSFGNLSSNQLSLSPDPSPVFWSLQAGMPSASAFDSTRGIFLSTRPPLKQIPMAPYSFLSFTPPSSGFLTQNLATGERLGKYTVAQPLPPGCCVPGCCVTLSKSFSFSGPDAEGQGLAGSQCSSHICFHP